jgi:hypothetical protein
MTTLPAATAKKYGLPLPREPVKGIDRTTPAGKQPEMIRPGLLKARVVGLDDAEYCLPCYFLGDPDAEVTEEGRESLPSNLLGLTGVVDKLRIMFDGTPGPGGAYGFVILEKLPLPSPQPASAPVVQS